MQTNQTPTEGNHSANQETEVALDGATCCASLTVQIAERCADQLLCTFDGLPANRLQIMRGPKVGQEENMGGWCRSAIVGIIAEVLRDSLHNVKRIHPYQRVRKTLKQMIIKPPPTPLTQRLVGVVMTRLVVLLVL